MSRWDKLAAVRRSEADVRANNEQGALVTLNYPSDSRRLWGMISGEKRYIWNMGDFHDFGLFVEDFVLHDYIAVPDGLMESFGPEIIASYAEYSDFPLYSFQKQLEVMLFSDSRALDELLTRRETKEVDLSNEEQLREEIVELRRKAESFVLLGIASGDYKRVLQRDTGLLDITSVASRFSTACQENGICISPGYVLRDAFSDQSSHISVPKKLYSEITSLHRDEIDLIEKWTGVQTHFTPPLVSVLLSRAASRRTIRRELLSLRDEYADLRSTIRETKGLVDSDLPLKQRLEAVRQLENVRHAVKAKAVYQTNSSAIYRTWSVLKKGRLIAALAALVDIAVEWDRERSLLCGLRRFVDLERLALSVEDNAGNIRRLFGDIVE